MYLDDITNGTFIVMRCRKGKKNQWKEYKLRVWKKIGDRVLQFIGGIKFDGSVKNDLNAHYPTTCPYRRRNYRTLKVISPEDVAILFAL